MGTHAAEHLFQTYHITTFLSNEKAELFHYNMAKLLFLCKWARLDIQAVVVFLSTHVKCHDEDDYKKLVQGMKYLCDTVHLPLKLEANDLHRLHWWIDGAFGNHSNVHSHMGGTFSLGHEVIYGTSTCQKFNTCSLTEAELVAIDDCMGQVLWLQYFLEGQGYHVEDAMIYQDRESAILLENNGCGSSGKHT